MRKPATPAQYEDEDALQIATADYLRLAWPSHLLWWHTPNGGERPTVERIDRRTGATYRFSPQAAKLKRMGTLPGVADCALQLPKGRMGFIELKVGDNKLDPPQEDFRDACLANGHGWALCRSVEQVEETCIRWLATFGLVPRARLAGRAA
ncbi:hypothetical protein [Phenylobacterium conjunctum]|uniref:VRR-NUC domain-containing protein n=1 Tax=Phenylobacterium conjunctum TaxID=1298959 RepID=A0ABW3SYP3_9CAUL